MMVIFLFVLIFWCNDILVLGIEINNVMNNLKNDLKLRKVKLKEISLKVNESKREIDNLIKLSNDNIVNVIYIYIYKKN